jgi:hypothetical protein
MYNVRKINQIINNDICYRCLTSCLSYGCGNGQRILNNKGEVLGFSVKARMGLWLETSKHKPVAWTWRRFLVILQKSS